MSQVLGNRLHHRVASATALLGACGSLAGHHADLRPSPARNQRR